MADANKDLADLRKEHKDLSDHSGRLAIVFLTILTLLGVSFSRAWNKVDSAEVESLVCEIHMLHRENSKQNRYDCSIDVSYVFVNKVEKYEDQDRDETNCSSCPKVIGTPTPTPNPCDCKSRLDQKAKEQAARRFPQPAFLDTSAMPATPPPTPTATPTPIPASEDPVCICQRQFEKELEDKAKVWFAAKLPIPGVDLTIDLRAWVFVLPVLFSLCGLYLYILRKKQHLLWAIGNQRLREGKAGDFTDLDRLHFEGDAPYHSFPSNVTTFLFVAFYLFMPLYVSYRAVSSWDRGGEAILLFLPLPVLCGLYAIAYGRHVSAKFEEQIASITNVEPRRKMNPLRSLARTLNPAIPLVTGSVLVLMTLFLSVIKPSWWSEEKFNGRALLLRTTKNLWVTRPVYYVESYYEDFGWAMYVLALLLAILTVFLLVPPVRSLLERRWIRVSALGLTSSVLAFVLIDFTVGLASFFDIGETSIRQAKLAIWLITVSLIWLSAWKTARHGSLWLKNNPALLVLYAPALPISLGFLLWLGLPGLIALLIGLCLMSLGFIHVQYCIDLAKESEVKPK